MLNILWLINITPPEASILINEKPTFTGGWLTSAAIALSEKRNVKLFISFPKKGINNIKFIQGKKIEYYSFPPVEYKESRLIENNDYLGKVLEKVKPDLIHIFGTENAHSLSMVNTSKRKNIKALISIQGLVSIIARHYMAGLPINIQKKFTFRDLVKQDNLTQQQSKFFKRGTLEIEALKKTDYIEGRTNWDKACAAQINPNAKYYTCNHILRESFYKNRWHINSCVKNSIFISQGYYPIKGLHFMLEAMPMILKRYPETKLYIAGRNFIRSAYLKEKLKLSTYGKYIIHLIDKHDLYDKVDFTGPLDEQGICKRYLKSNVFVCPSSIENSPNSLGEAMMLGVPCVASYVGGIPDMLEHDKEGFLYQSDAPYMLAYYICRIFEDSELAIRFSQNGRARALKTHDKEGNICRLVKIYKDMLSE